MHIWIALLTVLSVLAAWYFKANRNGRAAKNIKRKWHQRKKVDGNASASDFSLKQVTDPREAAAILMLLLMRPSEGMQFSEASLTLIQGEYQDLFQIGPDEAQRLTDYVRNRIARVEISDGVVKHMAHIILRSQTIRTRDLIELDTSLVAVSEMAGYPTQTQLKLLQIYRDSVGLKT